MEEPKITIEEAADEDQMTIKKALQLTVDGIKEIQVPVALADQIARPLCQAIANIEAVIDAIPDEQPKEGENDV